MITAYDNSSEELLLKNKNHDEEKDDTWSDGTIEFDNHVSSSISSSIVLAVTIVILYYFRMKNLWM